jgi:uncharacterized membrane protein SpoIIM required for sporulation
VDLDSYIAKYRPEWQRLEQACAGGGSGLAKRPGEEIEEVVRLYQRVSAHLAEVQARFRDPRLRGYLNGVVIRAHGAIYSSRPRTLAGAVRWFGPRYRKAIRRTAPFILAAAALLVIVAVACLLWVNGSREARAGLLPAFARGQIRRSGGRTDFGIPNAAVSTFILINNVQVAFLAFALGITLMLGTLYMVIQNAVLLGVLAGAYTAFGRAGAFWTLILPHGLLELTAICIAAGAGMRMGWALIDPGDRPRSRALAEESRDAVLVVLGVVPAFVLAAIIEGFVTGNVPGPVALALGAVVWIGYMAFLIGPGTFLRGGRGHPSPPRFRVDPGI